MILGHLGEMLPFAAYRIDRYYGFGGGSLATKKLERLPSEYLRSNFHITTSGSFSPPAFGCTLEVMGADRVMFSVDYSNISDYTARGRPSASPNRRPTAGGEFGGDEAAHILAQACSPLLRI